MLCSQKQTIQQEGDEHFRAKMWGAEKERADCCRGTRGNSQNGSADYREWHWMDLHPQEGDSDAQGYENAHGQMDCCRELY